MKVVAGLGNPGRPYRETRHNAGFMVLDRLAKSHGIRLKRNWRFPCDTGIVTCFGNQAALVRPRTFMNRSGRAVDALAHRWKIEPGDILVVVDDLDLPLGSVRLRPRGGAGGHNGLRSVIETLGTEAFPRLRVGVGPRPPGDDLVGYVLAPFSEDEQDRLEPALAHASRAVDAWLLNGVEAAMNEFNRQPAEER